jgi:hypothetical protein
MAPPSLFPLYAMAALTPSKGRPTSSKRATCAQAIQEENEKGA